MTPVDDKFTMVHLDVRKKEAREIFLIRDTVVERCNRRFGCETIHPTQNFISMNLLQMSCVITWAWAFLTSKVVEAVRGQKHHILAPPKTEVRRLSPNSLRPISYFGSIWELYVINVKTKVYVGKRTMDKGG